MVTTKLVFIGPNPKNVSQHSSKFWFAKLDGNKVIVDFGAIGEKRPPHVKSFGSPTLARINYQERVAKKLAEGYQRVTR